MGRPLKQKFFAESNPDNVGGEGIASLVGVSGLTGMTAGGPFAIDAAQITAPQITGGSKPTLTFTANAATTGVVTVVSSGSGYTSAPTVSVFGNLAAGGSGVATPAVTLIVGARANAISPQVRIAGTNRTSGNDIVKQVGSRRFKVRSQDGTAVCKLVAATPSAAGEMAIVATDTQSNTYWVKKITKNKVDLVRNTLVGSTWDIIDGDVAKWTITGSAVAPTAGGNPSQIDGPTAADIGTVVLNNA
jgi:hypothetical protein